MRVRVILGLTLLCGALGYAWGDGARASVREVWRDSYSYELCRAVHFGRTQGVVLMPSAVCLWDYASGEVRKISTCNYLSTARPVSATLDDRLGVLYVGHADGTIDAVRGEESLRVVGLRNELRSDSMVSIRALAVDGERLYALQGERVLEMRAGQDFDVEDQIHLWLGGTMVYPKCLFASGGQLYVGTSQGVVKFTLPVRGRREYQRLGDLTDEVVSLVRAGKELLALCESAGQRGLHVWDGSAWREVGMAVGEVPVGIVQGGDGNAYCVTNRGLWKYGGGRLSEEICALPYDAVGGGADANGNFFVGFRERGVQRFHGGVWRRLLDETPRFVSVYAAAAMGNAVVLTEGDAHVEGERPFKLFFWKEGYGRNVELAGAKNAGEVVVVDAQEERYLVCSDIGGVYEFRGDMPVARYDDGNSALMSLGGKTKVWSGIALTDGSWWFYNASNVRPLVVRDAQGRWSSYPWPDSRPTLPPSFAEDRGGALWIGHTASNKVMRIDPKEFLRSGGTSGVERKGADRRVFVRRVRVSGDDRLWLGYGNHGVVFAMGASGLAGKEASFSTYLFLNSEMESMLTTPMGDPSIEDLLIDHGNNVWIAMARGGLAHLMAEQQAVRRLYNVDNSPLPSRFLHTLALTQDGTLWIGTDRGAVRLTVDSEAANKDFSSVRIYPNPVRPGYQGAITIDGLKEGTVVKVADMGGTLARELLSNGGRAIWDGLNGLGEPVGSGVYLLFLSDREGKVTSVEKVVIVR